MQDRIGASLVHEVKENKRKLKRGEWECWTSTQEVEKRLKIYLGIKATEERMMKNSSMIIKYALDHAQNDQPKSNLT